MKGAFAKSKYLKNFFYGASNEKIMRGANFSANFPAEENDDVVLLLPVDFYWPAVVQKNSMGKEEAAEHAHTFSSHLHLFFLSH